MAEGLTWVAAGHLLLATGLHAATWLEGQVSLLGHFLGQDYQAISRVADLQALVPAGQLLRAGSSALHTHRADDVLERLKSALACLIYDFLAVGTRSEVTGPIARVAALQQFSTPIFAEWFPLAALGRRWDALGATGTRKSDINHDIATSA